MMKSKLISWTVLALLVTACGGRSGARNAAQQNYETVEEGSAEGVTSTIHGPGETLPPITGTNADTTTNFALNPNALPPMTSGSSIPPPPAAQPRPVAVPRPPPTTPEPEPAPPPATTTTVAPEKPAEPPQEEEPPADTTDTTGTEEPPPPPRSAGVLAG